MVLVVWGYIYFNGAIHGTTCKNPEGGEPGPRKQRVKAAPRASCAEIEFQNWRAFRAVVHQEITSIERGFCWGEQQVPAEIETGCVGLGMWWHGTISMLSPAAENQHLRDAGRDVAPDRDLCLSEAAGEAIAASMYWAGRANQNEELNVKSFLFSSSGSRWEVTLCGISALSSGAGVESLWFLWPWTKRDRVL